MFEPVLTGAQMAAADRYTSESLHIPSLVLMERAALAVAVAVSGNNGGRPGDDFVGGERCSGFVKRRTPRITVVAGRGNNGADGIAAGRILLDRGYEVTFYTSDENVGLAVEDDSSYGTQLRILNAYGVMPIIIGTGSLVDPFQASTYAPDYVIDALTGTGFHGEPSERMRSALQLIHRFSEKGAEVISVDMPSGVSATTGVACADAVNADVTVTFGFRKTGQILYPGATHCGQLRCVDIGITKRSLAAISGINESGHSKSDVIDSSAKTGTDQPTTVRTSISESSEMIVTLSASAAIQLLPKRDPAGNKGTFGKVLVVAGSEGMAGASLLAARAAYRCGAGMVKIFTPESNRIIVQETLPEALLTTYNGGAAADDGATLHDLLKKDLHWADVVLVGPGLSQSETAFKIVEETLSLLSEETIRGLVIDADALRILADRVDLRKLLAERPADTACILTPHPGELAALLHCEIRELKTPITANDPVDGVTGALPKIRELCEQLNAVIAAKDARTCVVSPANDPVYLNTTGSHGMATAGSGDVLAGMTAAFLAMPWDSSGEHSAAYTAACAADCLHGAAGDLAADRIGPRSLMAGDIADALAELFS